MRLVSPSPLALARPSALPGMLCNFSHLYFDAQASRCRHVDQGIETKQVDFPAQKVGDARLRDTEQLGDLRLEAECPLPWYDGRAVRWARWPLAHYLDPDSLTF